MINNGISVTYYGVGSNQLGGGFELSTTSPGASKQQITIAEQLMEPGYEQLLEQSRDEQRVEQHIEASEQLCACTFATNARIVPCTT